MISRKIQENASTEYADYSKESSTQARTLALAAIAVVWVIGQSNSKTEKFDDVFASVGNEKMLLCAAIFAVAGLAFDLLQYWLASMLWGRYRNILAVILEVDSHDGCAPSAKVKRAWNSMAGEQLAESIIHNGLGMSGVPGSASMPLDIDDKTALARAMLSEMKHHYDDSNFQMTSIQENVLDQPASPMYLLRIPAFLFYCKGLLVALSYAAILVALITSIGK